MNRQALEFIAQLKDEGGRSRFVQLAGEPDHVFWTCEPDGTLLKHEHTAHPATHRLHTIEDMARIIAKNHAAEAGGSVWIGRESIRYVFGESNRSEAYLSVPHNPQLATLEGMGRKKFDQKELITFLRVTMCRANLPPVDRLLDAARTMNWRKMETADSEIETGKVSIGRAIKTEVQNAASIPEEISFAIRLFAARSLTITDVIDLTVELDVEKQPTIYLTPIAGEIEDAIEKGQRELRRLLVESLSDVSISQGKVNVLQVPIYLGAFEDE